MNSRCSCPDLSLALPADALPADECRTMLFGVDLSKRPMKKSESMIDLNAYLSSSSSSSSSSDIDHHSYDCTHKKKRVSVPWTEDEHRRFLEGLQALGRSEWARIAREYVVTKNATQVASHAQKHFMHQSRSARKQCMRPSIFDMPLPLPPPSRLHQHLPCLHPSAFVFRFGCT